MIPLELTITDFRSYSGPETLDFRGLRRVCIVGPNGAGKSTIITAMLWALYGKSTARTNSDLVRRGADLCEVRLTFEADGNIYRIEREVKASGTSKAQLYSITEDSEELIAEGVKNVGGWIDSNLRLNYDTTTNASVLLQGKSDRFSAMTPSERKQFLSDVLGLSICEKIAKTARGKVRDMETRLDMKSSEIGRLEESLETLGEVPILLEEAKTALAEAEKAEKESVKKMGEIRARKQQLDKLLSEIRILEERSKNLRDDMTEAQTLLDETRERKNSLQNLLKRADEIEKGYEKVLRHHEKREQLIRAKSRKLEHEGNLARLEAEIERAINSINLAIERTKETRKGLIGQIAEIDKSLARESSIRKDYAELIKARKALDSIEESREAATEISNQIQKQKAIIEKEKASLQSTLDEKRNTLSHMKIEDLSLLKNKLEQIQEKLETLPNLRTRRDKLREEYQAAKAQIASLEREKANVSSLLEETTEKVGLLERESASECPLCGQSLDGSHRKKVLEDLNSEISAKETRITEIEHSIPEIQAVLKKLEKAGKELSEDIERLEKLESERAALSSRIEIACQSEKRAEALREEIIAFESKIEKGNFALENRREIETLTLQYENKKIPAELYDSARDRVQKPAQSEYEISKLAEIKDKGADLKEKIADLDSNIEVLHSELENGEAIAEKRRTAEDLREEISQIDFNQENLDQTEKEIEKLSHFEDKHQGLKSAQKEDGELNIRIAELGEKIQKLAGKAEQAENETAAKKSGLPEISRIEEELKIAEDRVTMASHAHRSAAVEFSQIKSMSETREKLIRKKRDAVAQKKTFEAEARIDRLLAEAMGKNGVPAFVIANALPEIEQEADRLLALLTGGEMSLRLVTTRGEKDNETLEIHISTPSGESSYESFSGGEAFRLDFALRVALSRFLSRGGGGISTLIIDEGFGTQDEEGLALLAEAIRAIEDEFELILVITHLERLKEEFDQIIEISKLPAKGSRAAIFA